jgi:hypothetical protein
VEIITTVPDLDWIDAKDESTIVANRYRFIVAKSQTGKLEIQPPIDGAWAWGGFDTKAQLWITKREFLENGYYEKFSKMSNRNATASRADEMQRQQARQMCEAQKQTCLATCGNPTYWNGRSYVDNQSWSMCYTRCNQISCN